MATARQQQTAKKQQKKEKHWKWCFLQEATEVSQLEGSVGGWQL
jgi:hypothetical protein